MKARTLFSLVLLVCLALPVASVPIGAGPPPPPSARQMALETLERVAGETLYVEWAEGPGSLPLFIGGQIPAEQPDPEQAARAFFDRYAALYSIAVPQRELQLARLEEDPIGMHHIRFNQTVNGVPVFGGQLIVHLRDGFITAINGNYFPNLQVDTSPRLTQDEALAIVLGDVGDDAAEFRADRSGLVVYVENGRPYLTWKVNVFSWRSLGNWLYFVDAHNGQVVHKLNQMDTLQMVKVYTANNQWLTDAQLPGDFVCGYGSGSDPNCTGTSDLDARGAFTNTSKIYDYYYQTFGRKSYDGNDTELRSTVHYGVNYQNAFWNGSQMVYGDGDKFARAFDVVAHELTHGVTQETADLIYEHQPGALNESFSDVMAVFAGCSASTGQADCDWLMGETLNMGAMRRLDDPGYYGDPDHWSEYEWLPLEHDNGGVHTNSGIPNKAAYLLTAGGTYYGVTVTGLGYTRTEQIYYRALAQYLTVYSDFYAARAALYASCRDLIGSYGITQSHCDQVLNAWAAVGIGSPAVTPGPNKVYLPLTLRAYPPSTCPTTNVLANGGFETGNFSSWITSGTPQITTFRRSGNYSALLGNGNYQDDRIIQAITVPADARYMQLQFYAAVSSADSTSYPYDFLYLRIEDGSGNPITPQYWLLDNTDGDGTYGHVYGWWRITLTWNEILQRNLRVRIRATTDSSLYTAFFIDDVTWTTTCTRYTLDAAQETLQPFVLEVIPVEGPPSTVSPEEIWP
ncbi:MAG: M4 family metallopeptidase [Anaerolineae bacterium]